MAFAASQDFLALCGPPSVEFPEILPGAFASFEPAAAKPYSPDSFSLSRPDFPSRSSTAFTEQSLGEFERDETLLDFRATESAALAVFGEESQSRDLGSFTLPQIERSRSAPVPDTEELELTRAFSSFSFDTAPAREDLSRGRSTNLFKGTFTRIDFEEEDAKDSRPLAALDARSGSAPFLGKFGRPSDHLAAVVEEDVEFEEETPKGLRPCVALDTRSRSTPFLGKFCRPSDHLAAVVETEEDAKVEFRFVTPAFKEDKVAAAQAAFGRALFPAALSRAAAIEFPRRIREKRSHHSDSSDSEDESPEGACSAVSRKNRLEEGKKPQFKRSRKGGSVPLSELDAQSLFEWKS